MDEQMDKTLVPQSLSVPMEWQGLVFRNGLEKTSWKGQGWGGVPS